MPTLLDELKIISLSHHHLPLDVIGHFQIDDEHREEALESIKKKYQLKELFYLATCNRVELVFIQPGYLCRGMSSAIFSDLCRVDIQDSWLQTMELFEAEDAAQHLFRVSSSLESALVGEQEIITQLRKSFEWGFEKGLAGDNLRLLMKKAIETAKRCYSETEIATRPISTAFLAWQRLQDKHMSPDSRIVLVGAGQIITSICEFLKKSDFTNIVVVNRSISSAQQLAERVEGKALELDRIEEIEGFDAIISCTGSTEAVIDAATYAAILGEDSGKKLVIDLAIPADMDAKVMELFDVDYVGLDELQTVREQNLQHRQQEVSKCEVIIEEGLVEISAMYKQRQVELAMREIPSTIKAIRQTAMGDIFAKDLEGLDEHSVEVLQKIMDYMEKKYISLPMKLAREVMLDNAAKQ